VLVGGLLATVLGLAVLLLGCNAATAGLQGLALLVYLGLYTPLKRRTSTNTWIGAIPGAMPVLAGAAAASGAPSRLSFVVFALVFLWQLPHFFAIASMYREQYRSGGLRMLSGDDPGDRLLRWQLPMMVMSVMLVSMLPVLLGHARTLYGLVALAAGAVFLVAALGFRARPDRPRARRVVLASVVYLPLVLAALVVDVVSAGGPRAELPRLGRLPEMDLVAQDGRAFGRADLAGEPWIVDFLFTSCAGVCVPMTRTMVELQHEELPARYLSISVDPERDVPAALAAYRERWDGDTARWTLVTGSHEEVGRIAAEGLRLPVNTRGSEVEGMPSLFHSKRFALVDGQGWVRGYYLSDDSLELDRLRADVRALAVAASPAAP
jgi:protoheme IX farnesyltransferase